MTQFGAKADKEGFIVVAPDGIDRHWNEGKGTGNGTIDDVGFVRQLIRNLELRLAIDPKRSTPPVFRTAASSRRDLVASCPTPSPPLDRPQDHSPLICLRRAVRAR